jgi:hypothetical protein
MLVVPALQPGVFLNSHFQRISPFFPIGSLLTLVERVSKFVSGGIPLIFRLRSKHAKDVSR